MIDQQLQTSSRNCDNRLERTKRVPLPPALPVDPSVGEESPNVCANCVNDDVPVALIGEDVVAFPAVFVWVFVVEVGGLML